MMAFSSASSVGALPFNMECAERLGARREVASFVLPLGATINMDGTAIMQGMTAVFVAQLYGIDMTWVQILTIVIAATMGSIGSPGMPGVVMATLVVVLSSVGFPLEVIGLIVSIDKFPDMFKIHRNIVFFDVNPQLDTTGVFYRYNQWARPQIVVQVCAYDAEGASELLRQQGSVIVSAIEQAERDRVIGNTMLYEEGDIAKAISEIFPGTLHFPVGYKLRKATENFIWVANDKQYVYQDVLIYRYPADKEHPFSSENIIRHRNEIMQENVPGMFENTYMTTSDFFIPQIEYLRYRGRDFVQTRGMWEVKNDYMGGPFVSHSFYSPDGKDIIVVEAFVYAPRYNKRQYLRQVESLLYTWAWNGSGSEADEMAEK